MVTDFDFRIFNICNFFYYLHQFSIARLLFYYIFIYCQGTASDCEEAVYSITVTVMTVFLDFRIFLKQFYGRMKFSHFYHPV